jgi:arabinan endo-1,5-alpha-L-arabinosidase
MVQQGRARSAVRLTVLLTVLLALALSGAVSGAATARGSQQGKQGGENPGYYSNPLKPRIPGDGVVESCADPTVIHGQQPGDTTWYMYCTTDPLNDEDLDANGDLVFHRVPTMTSEDLVHWTYVGDAFQSLPSWADPSAALWAPDVVYSKTFDQYYMFVVVTDTTAAAGGSADPNCHGDNAIGVATSDSATGPWTFAERPVVAPRSAGGECNFLWTFDPDVLGDAIDTESILYYGSYFGGIFGTRLTLTEDGAVADPAATKVAIDNKYEGANVVFRDGFYYLFVSATNCCNGALTGYSVFVGRSRSPLGPFVDREGNSLLDVQAGGTPVISMNGNRWVGTGHNTVFQDAAGDWWTIYHAVDQGDPFFETSPGFTKRPALLDALDWVDGWPTVNGGSWASDRKMPAPAGQPGEVSRHRTRLVEAQEPGRLLFADEFSGTSLSSAWSVIRPERAELRVRGGVLTMKIQEPVRVPAPTPEDPDATKLVASDLNSENNTASVLVRDAPRGDYVVETAVRLNVPDSPDCCYNFAQGGVLVYEGDDNFVKLTNTSIWNTRQTEWAKELFPVPEGWNRYGNTVVGPPSDFGEWTYLRIAVEQLSGDERRQAGGDRQSYTAYTSQDGRTWVRGGTWTHTLTDAQLGLVAMGLTPEFTGDYTVDYDYVRVFRLREGGHHR